MPNIQTERKATRLFLVDDHNVLREGLKILLGAESDIQVVGEAGDGNEIVANLFGQNIDVLVLDIDMPQVSGLEVIDSITTTYPNINILVFSMHDNEKYIHQMLSKGAKGYVLKSCKKEELVRAIKTVSTGDTYLCEKVSKSFISYISKQKEPKRNPKSSLTSREIEVLKLVATGLTNQLIGEQLHISHRTVDTHRRNIMEKLNLHNAVALTNYVKDNDI